MFLAPATCMVGHAWERHLECCQRTMGAPQGRGQCYGDSMCHWGLAERARRGPWARRSICSAAEISEKSGAGSGAAHLARDLKIEQVRCGHARE
jgi:hypothetical protein